MNQWIRALEIRVVGSDGGQLGIMTPEEALSVARSEDLDLVEIAPTANPPVCKIMDYGKYKYEVAKKEKVARKKQSSTVLKEIRLSPSTDEHDLMTKVRRARKFLEEGAKIKVSIRFRGRMITHKEFGTKMMERMASELEDIAKLDNPPSMEGMNMTMMLVKK